MARRVDSITLLMLVMKARWVDRTALGSADVPGPISAHAQAPRTARAESGAVVVRADLDRAETLEAAARERAHRILEPLHALRRRADARREDVLQRAAELLACRFDLGDALVVDDEHLGFGDAQEMDERRRVEERIQRHDDGAEERNGPECPTSQSRRALVHAHDEFGHVAREDGNALALDNTAALLEAGRERQDLGVDIAVCLRSAPAREVVRRTREDGIVLIDEVLTVCELTDAPRVSGGQQGVVCPRTCRARRPSDSARGSCSSAGCSRRPRASRARGSDQEQ